MAWHTADRCEACLNGMASPGKPPNACAAAISKSPNGCAEASSLDPEQGCPDHKLNSTMTPMTIAAQDANTDRLVVSQGLRSCSALDVAPAHTISECFS